MCTYIYIYINTNVRIYIYTYFHICIYKYIQIFVYTYIYYIHTCNYVYCIHIKLMLTVSFFTNNSEHSISLMSLVFFRGSGFGVVVKEGVWLLATIREESCDVSLLSQKSAPKKTFLGVKIPTLGWKLPKKKTQSNEVSFSCKGKRPPFAFFLVWKISRLRVFFHKNGPSSPPRCPSQWPNNP